MRNKRDAMICSHLTDFLVYGTKSTHLYIYVRSELERHIRHKISTMHIQSGKITTSRELVDS